MDLLFVSLLLGEALLSAGVAVHSTSLYVHDRDLQGIFLQLDSIPIIYLKLYVKTSKMHKVLVISK